MIMETGYKNAENMQFGYTVLNLNIIRDSNRFGQTGYNHHNGSYTVFSGHDMCEGIITKIEKKCY